MRAAFLVAIAVAGCEVEDLDADGVPGPKDCNDRDPAQGRKEPLYVDSDGDGFGGTEETRGCPGNSWLVARGGDCDDLDPAVFPGAVEVGCDGRDNDCDAGTADGPAITVGGTWSSVQEAIDAAGYNEVVELCTSTIREAIVVRGRPILLRPIEDDATVVIDGSDFGTATIRVSTDLVLERVVVRGGAGAPAADGATVGGGLLVEACADVTLEGVVVEANTADRGAGIAVVGCGALTLRDTVVRDNRAIDGGGIHADGPVAITVDAGEIGANVATRGGGWWIGAEPTVALSPLATVSGNVADQGGGVWLGGAVLDAGGAAFVENHAFAGGGLWGGGTLRGATLVENAADRGGGLFVSGALVVEAGVLDGNVATVGDGGGALVPAGASLTLSDTVVTGGTALDQGGAVYAEGTLTLADVRLEDAAADRGGALACVGCDASGDQVEIRRSVAVTAGGGIGVGCGGAVSLVASTLAEGVAPDGALARIEGGTLSVDTTIVTDGLAGPGGGWLSLAPACGAAATLSATDAAIGAAPDAISLAGELLPPPGSTFVCAAPPDDRAGCLPP